MVIFDTNMILRYLLDDNKEMAERAEQYLENEDVSVTVEVIAEVVYVLKGVYQLQRDIIASTVKGFLELANCSESDSVRLALDIFATHGLDFVDCILYAYHICKGAQIATFDKKLLKLLAEA